MTRRLQDILKIFTMTFTLPMFTTRCYPCCPLLSLLQCSGSHCSPGSEEWKPRGVIVGSSTQLLQKLTERQSSWKQAPISQICVWCVGLKITLHRLWEVRAHYSLHLAFAQCVLTRHRAGSLELTRVACLCPTRKTSSHRKMKADPCVGWFCANSCPGSSLRRINICNKAHHAPIAAAICIGRLMLDEGEVHVPEGKGT